MTKEYPLYPSLPEEGQKEAQQLIDWFKEKLKKSAEEVLSDFYCKIMPYAETDSWTNFRNELLDGFRNYGNRKIQAEYDFKEIRQAIFTEYRDEIIQDLNQDLVKEVEDLKRTIEIIGRNR
jgi:hypothetical protein